MGQGHRGFATIGQCLAQISIALRRILAPSVIHAQIMAGDTNAALATLDGLLGVATDGAEVAALKLLQGQALANEDAIGTARRKLRDASEHGDRETALAAKGDEIDLDLREGLLDAATANVELNVLAPSWEGRQQAPAMERRRARVAAAAGDWPTAPTGRR